MILQTLDKFNISFHRDNCSINNCQNKEVCYHLKKGNKKEVISQNIWYVFIEDILKKYTNANIYDSLCKNELDILRVDLLNRYKQYSLTLPYFTNDFILKYWAIYNMHLDQIQTTVYDIDTPVFLKNMTKIFLIKDVKTLNSYKELSTMSKSQIKNLGKIHFAIDENFLNKSVLREILNVFLSKKLKHEKNITLDSCLTSYFLNGVCPYKKDYIDISQDLSYRFCPFSEAPDGYLTIDNIINVQLPDNISEVKKCRDCNYNKIFNFKETS